MFVAGWLVMVFAMAFVLFVAGEPIIAAIVGMIGVCALIGYRETLRRERLAAAGFVTEFKRSLEHAG